MGAAGEHHDWLMPANGNYLVRITPVVPSSLLALLTTTLWSLWPLCINQLTCSSFLDISHGRDLVVFDKLTDLPDRDCARWFHNLTASWRIITGRASYIYVQLIESVSLDDPGGRWELRQWPGMHSWFHICFSTITHHKMMKEHDTVHCSLIISSPNFFVPEDCMNLLRTNDVVS